MIWKLFEELSKEEKDEVYAEFYGHLPTHRWMEYAKHCRWAKRFPYWRTENIPKPRMVTWDWASRYY